MKVVLNKASVGDGCIEPPLVNGACNVIKDYAPGYKGTTVFYNPAGDDCKLCTGLACELNLGGAGEFACIQLRDGSLTCQSSMFRRSRRYVSWCTMGGKPLIILCHLMLMIAAQHQQRHLQMEGGFEERCRRRCRSTD